VANHLAAPLARCARSTFKAGPRARSDGVSRLSAHLHFGMVSPFRVAREALAAGTYSANKFVDEFLTWREVAYAFCFHHSADLETLQARGRPLREGFGAALCAQAHRQGLRGQHQHAVNRLQCSACLSVSEGTVLIARSA